MQTGADKGAAYSGTGGRRCVPVVDNEVQHFTEIVKPGPSVQLLPLVGPHEPEEHGARVQLGPQLRNAPAPAWWGKLQIQFADASPGKVFRGQFQHIEPLFICKMSAFLLLERGTCCR